MDRQVSHTERGISKGASAIDVKRVASAMGAKRTRLLLLSTDQYESCAGNWVDRCKSVQYAKHTDGKS